MSNRFDDHEKFFNDAGDNYLHPTTFGDNIYSFTVEEMYQHFKARYNDEKHDDDRARKAQIKRNGGIK